MTTQRGQFLRGKKNKKKKKNQGGDPSSTGKTGSSISFLGHGLPGGVFAEKKCLERKERFVHTKKGPERHAALV